MREFKFRAWSKYTSRMFEFDDLEYMNIKGELNFHNLIKGDYAGIIPLQYTGLKDKSGNEIYEGDILLNNDGLGGKVFFEEGLCAYSVEFIKYNMLLMDYKAEHFDTMEIIGNVYENQELI